MTRSILITLFLLGSVATFAQTFVIERIDVDTRRSRPAIVRAETRLAAGHSYTAAQIDQAVYRVRRLPFVIDATYTLEEGATPDALVLRISVFDEAPFNYEFGVQGVAIRGGYAVITTGLGVRFFPAPAGTIDLTAGGVGYSTGGNGSGNFGDLGVQYTQYGLFRGASIGVGVTTHYTHEDRLMSPRLLVAVPITQTQTLRGTYRRGGDQRQNDSILVAEWLYETTDDPHFARRGLDLAIGPQWQKFNYKADYNVGRPSEFHIDDRFTDKGFGASAEKYWPWREQFAYWGRGNVISLRETGTNNGRERIPVDNRRGDLLAGIAWNFDGGRANPDYFHRIRLELGAGYHLDRTSSRTFTSERSGPSIFAGVVYRSRFGLIDVGVSYVSESD